MKSLKKNKFVILNIFVISFFLLCFLGCRTRAEQKSLANHFELIDALIQQNQFSDAQRELKKIEKKAYDYWTYLGIYKRFDLLDDQKNSEAVLKKALKKNKDNPELTAVYSNFLLHNNRIDEAVEISKGLRNTKWGSLYSEAILRQAQNKSMDEEQKFTFYENEDFYSVYLDAYNANYNPIWIKNCTVYNLRRGLYSNAAALLPPAVANADDAYFWALVLYDAHKYYECVDKLLDAQNYLGQSVSDSSKVSLVKLVALASDAYMALSNMEMAEQMRKQVIYNLDNLYISTSDKDLLPIILVNSAIWSKNQNFLDECSDTLFYLVKNFPLYYPGLILYADFAYESNLERPEDDEIKALRKAGIQSTSMERYDNRRKIPLSDAFYRIDYAIKEEPNPYLEITKLDLRYKTQKNLSVKDKNRDLWNMLENNYREDDKYQTLLVLYALNFLINNQMEKDAWNLFDKYVHEKLEFEANSEFWETFQEKMYLLDLSIVEFGGYFAAKNRLTVVARRIYEYCVYESGGILDSGLVSPLVSTESCMNLADLYYSCGEKKLALDLYGSAAGRESLNYKRSEIFYRIACIYVAQNDIKSARRSSEYALTIFPDNIKASLLLLKLNN